MNPTNLTLVPSSRDSKIRWRLLAAGLTLGLAFLCQTARSQPAPDGQDGPAPAPNSYGAAVLALDPVAFWQLNETNAVTATLQAYDYTGHGFNGTYGVDAVNLFNGINGPLPTGVPAYPGFADNQGAVLCNTGDVNSSITLPNLNLNTNAVTISIWINPSADIGTFIGLLMFRNATFDAAGLGFGGTTSGGMAALGYTWNDNNGDTYNWNSGLFPAVGTWSYVTLVVQSNQATLYMYYIDGNGNPQLQSAVNPIAHTVEAFSSTTGDAAGIYLGSDANQNSVGAANNAFGGEISDAAIFNKALTTAQINALFAAGLGVKGFSPTITAQPQGTNYFVSGSPAQLIASGIGGTTPIALQWQLDGTNIPNNANFSGVNSNILTISSVTPADVGTYQLILTNNYGSNYSSNAVVITQTPSLVGQWFTNNSLADVSGYAPTNQHAGVPVGALNYVFTTDVPSGKAGQSISFPAGDTGIAINNSSTLDTNYDNTFDNVIDSAFTVILWSKGWPTSWSPWVSKFGETESGWQLRQAGGTDYSCFTVRDGGGGASNLISGSTFGEAPWDDMSSTNIPSNDGQWHLYAGVFNTGTGERTLFVDAQVAAYENAGNVPYTLAPAAHLCIAAKDAVGGNSFGNFSTIEIYDARMYNYALSQAQIAAIYGTNAAVVNGQPKSTVTFAGSKATLSAVVAGTPPITYQWQLNGTAVSLLADSTNFTGTNTSALTILNVTGADAGTYILTVTNKFGGAVSSNAVVSIAIRSLLGEWFIGDTNLNDVSGYSPTNTHDGYDSAGNGAFAFSLDVPPGKTGESLFLTSGSTGIAIGNSSTNDVGYTNTFDHPMANTMTVAFWAKGWPGGWSPFVSKNGDSGSPNAGWDLRNDGQGSALSPCWTIRGAGGSVKLGTAVYGNGEDTAGTNTFGNDGKWHHYAGTYNAGTGVRALFVDGVISAYSTGNSQYNLAPYAHVCIGEIDHSPGNSFTGYFTGKFYDVRVYNYDLTSNQVAALAALPNPAILAQPNSVSNYLGETATFSVSVSGTGTLTNQWQFNHVNLVDGTYGGVVVSGSRTTTLTIGNLTTNFQGVYDFVLSNTNGTQTSIPATLTVVGATAPPPAGNLVGSWITGAATLADTSGYSPAGTHDGYGVKGNNIASSGYVFTNDLPPYAGATGQSLWLDAGTTGIAISNTATSDAGYVNTFDEGLTNAMTVMCWARGLPGGWNPWVSKYGEGPGWQLRVNGGVDATWTVRGTGGADDMQGKIGPTDGLWHLYAGTYDLTSGNRFLYVDGVLAGSETGNLEYNMAKTEHLAIGAKDSPATAPAVANFGNYFTGVIYGVRIYNTALTQAQINSFLMWEPTAPQVPVFNLTNNVQVIPGAGGSKVGGEFVISWSTGSLWESTNLATSWIHLTNATSPYTNIIGGANEYFKLSNP